MAIPHLDDYLFATLVLAPEDKTFTLKDLLEPVAQKLHLTENDITITLPSGRPKHRSQIRWSLVLLTMADLLIRVHRGIYKISHAGIVYREKNNHLTRKDLYHFPKYREWIENINKSKNKCNETNKIDIKQSNFDNTPEEDIDNAIVTINSALASELLDAIKANTPQFFEQLVVDLMLAMGYGGSITDAGKAFKTTGDGGIDGVIKEDKLGLSNIYLQAKRWDNTVGCPEIQAFAGAIIGKHSNRGVFITTSKFSNKAIEYVKSLSHPVIILIDGEKLVQFMIDYGVGVSTYKTYIIKRLDSDYFNEDA